VPYEPGPVPRLISRALSRVLSAQMPYHDSPWYSSAAREREIGICLQTPFHGQDLYHFFYAEDDLRIASLWKYKSNTKIVGSFHQPPEYLHRHIEDKRYIQGVDGAVVMSTSQIPYMQEHLPRARIHHVPHGVHTGFWCPDPSIRRWEEPTFLFVGQWLRDIPLVIETIRRLNQVDPKIRFEVVTFEEHAAQFEGLRNLQVMWGIPEERLLEHYRRAHALFLPLKMSTANNAILEAMSCGTGVVSTNTGGVPEYLDDECGMLIEPGDVEGAASALLKIAGDSALPDRMGAAARRRAEQHYSWEVVGNQMNDAYRQILNET
jgi:glycosyltransferase involved in cell wall biosynthesis